jgi:hypothetical protein
VCRPSDPTVNRKSNGRRNVHVEAGRVRLRNEECTSGAISASPGEEMQNNSGDWVGQVRSSNERESGLCKRARQSRTTNELREGRQRHAGTNTFVSATRVH